MSSPGSQKKLNRAIRLYLYELKNGCVDCMALKGVSGYCIKHREEAYDVVLHPRKYITLKESK